MSDYNNYNFTIKADDLLQVLRDSAAHGYSSFVVINGMYYNLDLGDVERKAPEDFF